MAFVIAGPPPGSLFHEGDTLHGRYTVVREIARGGSAVVYEAVEATDGRTSTPCALKCITLAAAGDTPADKAAMKQARSRIKSEIKTSAAMRHPNVVALLNVFAEGNSMLVLVYELVKGEDLLGVINNNNGALSEAAARHYFRQLLSAVEFVHENGYVHRDIKPENCVVAADGTLKLIDFGLSKHLESARTLGVGTPDYMSPELVCNLGEPASPYDASLSDIWSLGCTLFLMAVGAYPFEDADNPKDVASTLRNAVQGRFRPLPPALEGTALAGLLRAMLQPRPADRIDLAGVRAHPWVGGAR